MVQWKQETVKGPRAVTLEKRTSGSQILHSKTRRVKFNRTRIISCKAANRKEVVNHIGGNKNIGKTERAMSISSTHGSDRKTRAIGYHDGGGTRRMRRVDRRE